MAEVVEARACKARNAGSTPAVVFTNLNGAFIDAQTYRDGTLGHRSRIRLEQSPDFEDLMLPRELDKAGRRRRVEVAAIAESIAFIRRLDQGA